VSPGDHPWPICWREHERGRAGRIERQSWLRSGPAATATERVLVVDTSAILEVLAARNPAPGLAQRLADDGDLHAPHLIDVEILHALRRIAMRGEISEDRAADVRSDFADTAIVRYGHLPLSDRMWELRHNLSAYDAAFVALAELLDVPLVTCDGRVASASGHDAHVELFDVEVG
jgi:predicted nucleic acid-binding protein